MSVFSLRTAARRSPALAGVLALSATLVLAGCGDDVVDDDVEQDVEQGVDEVEEEVDEEETDD